MNICEYGCNKLATFKVGKKWCCSEKYNSCEYIRHLNSIRQQKAYTEKELKRLNLNIERLFEIDDKPFNISNLSKSRRIKIKCIECDNVRECSISTYFKSKSELCKPCSAKGDRNNSKRIDVREKIKNNWKTRTHEYANDDWIKKNGRVIKLTPFNEAELNFIKENIHFLFEENGKKFDLNNYVRTRKIYRVCSICNDITWLYPKLLLRIKNVQYCGKCARLYTDWNEILTNSSGRILKNKVEIKLESYLNELNLNNFEFTGDGKFWIQNKNPDFIDKIDNLIIECFGDYWHSKKVTGIENDAHVNDRISFFQKFNYNTLVLWEHEINTEPDLVKTKIIQFYNQYKRKF